MPTRRLRLSTIRLARTVLLGSSLVAIVVAGPAPAAAATTGIDVQLPLGHQIRGVITDPNGDPIDGAFVDANDGQHFLNARTAADGSYILHGAGDGDYHVLASVGDDAYHLAWYGFPDPVPNEEDAATVSVAGADVAAIDIRLIAKPPTGIAGTVRDPDGSPVAGVLISASGDGGNGTVSSAADGTYRVPGLGPGDYELLVEPPTGTPFFPGRFVDGTIGSDEEAPTLVTVTDVDTTGVDITLAVGRTISGHVTVARGPVAIAAEGPRSVVAVLPGSGDFVIEGLPPGTYNVLFGDPPAGEFEGLGGFPYGAYGPGGTLVGQGDAEQIDLSSENAVLDPISLPRGTDIVGQVTDGKKPISSAFLFICDVSGQAGCARQNAAPDGTFRVRHLPTADYSIFVSAAGRVVGYYQANGFTIDESAATPIHVVSGAADVKGIKVAVPAGASVSGRITGPTGEPVAGATVTVFPIGIPENWLQPVTGADGQFTETGIPTNEYGLSVRPAQGSDYLPGYYRLGAPGSYTDSFQEATTFRVIEDNDHKAPAVTFLDPAPGATEVSPAAAVTIRFSEPVDGVTTSSASLRDSRGRVVAASVSFDAQSRTARIEPVDSLQPATKYRVTLTSAIVDWSGNHFAGASWSFTTITP